MATHRKLDIFSLLVESSPSPSTLTSLETTAFTATSIEQPPPLLPKTHIWTPEEDDLIIFLRGSGMKWDDISTRFVGRSAISCRLHYQNYLERRSTGRWNEDTKNKLAILYERYVYIVSHFPFLSVERHDELDNYKDH